MGSGKLANVVGVSGTYRCYHRPRGRRTRWRWRGTNVGLEHVSEPELKQPNTSTKTKC